MLQTLFAKTSELAEFKAVRHDDAVLVLPFIDEELARRLADVLVRRALHPGLVVLIEDDRRLGFIKTANAICSRSSSRYFGYLAQDVFPSDGWLQAALSILDATENGLLAFNDGRFHGTLAVFGLARRTWLKSLYHRFVFFPGYQSHYGDTELSAIAIHQNTLVYNPGCVMLEVDYEKHTKANNPDDKALFEQRMAQGFGGLL